MEIYKENMIFELQYWKILHYQKWKFVKKIFMIFHDMWFIIENIVVLKMEIYKESIYDIVYLNYDIWTMIFENILLKM